MKGMQIDSYTKYHARIMGTFYALKRYSFSQCARQLDAFQPDKNE